MEHIHLTISLLAYSALTVVHYTVRHHRRLRVYSTLLYGAVALSCAIELVRTLTHVGGLPPSSMAFIGWP